LYSSIYLFMVARLTKVRRTIRKQKARVVKDATLLKGIKQGVGMVVKKPFGSRRVRPGKFAIRNKISSRKAALCALTNLHLPLPRAVGAYTVTKTTTIIDSARTVMLFGCFKGNRVNHPDAAWFDTVAVGSANPSNPINGASNAGFWIDTALSSSGFNSCRVVPAAITVQVMCPKNLQSADGITYIGRSKQVLDLMGDTRTWTELANELVSFSAPRLCSAGKLALRGVKVDAIPYNMSQLADFTPRGLVAAAPFDKTWNEGSFEAQFEGFAPIFVYNKNNVELQYLVTVEWRTRFDPGNPAYAGHTYHPIASDTCWNDTVRGMEEEGHGVVDMAEGIVDFGDAVMVFI
jgi:hypothetical protein